MNITLRKASALQTAIQEAMRTIEVKLTVDLNEFEDAQGALAQANATALKNDQRREALLRALYTVRAQVGNANATAGISNKLARAAYIDKRVGVLATFLQDEAVQDSLAVVEGKIDRIKNDKSDRRIYGYNDSVKTGVLIQSQIDRFKAEQLALKKEKQKLNDEILELNVRTEVTLDPEVETTLVAEGLL